MITVASKRDGAEGEYIGRPSVLGNPFAIGRDGTRDEVIAKYRVWLWDEVRKVCDLTFELERLATIALKGDLTLVCWCAPQPCHGDVVKAYIEWFNENRTKPGEEL